MDELNKNAFEFQKKYGAGPLFEVYLIGIIDFLIESGLTTREVLSKFITQEMINFDKAVQAQQEAARAEQEKNNSMQLDKITTTAPKIENQSLSSFKEKLYNRQR